jgi:hypothetical protein
MKDFEDVVKLKRIPATFRFRCTLCDFETNEFDYHLGLIKMNEHVIADHAGDVKALDMEELYSRKPTITLDSF